MRIVEEHRLGDLLGLALQKAQRTRLSRRRSGLNKAGPKPIKKPAPVSQPVTPATITNLAPDIEATMAAMKVIHRENVLSGSVSV